MLMASQRWVRLRAALATAGWPVAERGSDGTVCGGYRETLVRLLGGHVHAIHHPDEVATRVYIDGEKGTADLCMTAPGRGWADRVVAALDFDAVRDRLPAAAAKEAA